MSNNKEHFIGLNQKQQKFKNTLELMKYILEKNDIPFFLFCGTALGAYREKKFIEHDPDIDIGIFEKDFYKISNVMNKYKNLFKLIRFFPKNGSKITEYTFKDLKNNVNIDIFEVIKNNDYNIHYSYGRLCEKKPFKRCTFKNKFELTKIKFLNKIYNIPTKNFLISHYGNDWYKIKKYSYNEGIKNNHYKSLL